ncbi:penicillin-binding protein [bacterium]|nr:penicillin-binding protein [bacterium]
MRYGDAERRVLKKPWKWGRFWSRHKNIFIFGLSAFLFTVGALLLWAATIKIPDTSDFDKKILSQSTKIYDRTGETLLYSVNENVRRTVVSLDDIATTTQQATIAIEDERFYEHHGVDPKAIFRAVFVNLGNLEYSQGGSTITQQVAKNTFLTPEKTLTRKLKEWMLALKIESLLTKQEILELYFNLSPYGGNIYGIEEAAQSFFGKKAKDLSLVESAYLVSLPQAPSYYSPYGNHRDALEQRKNIVLSQMEKLGFISKEELARAKNETAAFFPQQEHSIKAPHFVMMVRQYLEEKYGKEAAVNAGLKVTTTLDGKLQASAEEIIKKYGEENVTKFNAGNAATVGMDAKNGQILVMIGSRDYFNEEIDGNFNVAIAPNRQPGSSFKPFVYASAFMKGYTSETVVFDLPTEFNSSCAPGGVPKSPEMSSEECYHPENYDNAYRGPMTLRNALAQSVNIPAVKVFYLAGLKDAIETAKKMGITTLKDYRRYGLSLVLGSGEVSLLEMTGAYAVFANEGIRNSASYILKIEDADGNVLEEWRPESEEAIPEEIARKINNILSDNNARAPAFGSNSALFFSDREVAVKTGTSNDYRDAWIIGYTPSFVLGSWAGNNDNTPMSKQVAGFIVAPMWNAIMKIALAERVNEPFMRPAPESPDLKPVLRGVFTDGNPFNTHEILFWVDKDDPRGPEPSSPTSDPQFANWEAPVQAWAVAQFTGGLLPQGTSLSPFSSTTSSSTTATTATTTIIALPPPETQTGAAMQIFQ